MTVLAWIKFDFFKIQSCFSASDSDSIHFNNIWFIYLFWNYLYILSASTFYHQNQIFIQDCIILISEIVWILNYYLETHVWMGKFTVWIQYMASSSIWQVLHCVSQKGIKWCNAPHKIKHYCKSCFLRQESPLSIFVSVFCKNILFCVARHIT
jgi:hypothetical protein